MGLRTCGITVVHLVRPLTEQGAGVVGQRLRTLAAERLAVDAAGEASAVSRFGAAAEQRELARALLGGLGIL